MKRIVCACLLLVALVACSNSKHDTTTATTSASTTSATSTTAPFTTTPVSTPETTEQGQLVDVQVGDHAQFARVVFRFSNLVPGYSVRPADPPFVQDGSGKEVTVDGDGHLTVRLIARAHDDNGKSTAPSAIAVPKTSSIRGVVMTGDFEGVVNFVIGTSTPTGFKVFTLTSPPRLVIDVQSP